MSPLHIPFAVVTALSLWACGPSAAETEQNLLRQIANKQHLEQQLDSTHSAIEVAKETISDLYARLEVERVRLGRIEAWQLGRAPATRDAQITQQVKLIQDIDENIKEWEVHYASLSQQAETMANVLNQYSDIDMKMESSGVK